MPTYDYRCKNCESEQEEFHGINAKPRIKCVVCGKPCKKLMGRGAGVIFKGHGFYGTDYATPSESDEAKRAADRLAETDPSAPALDQD